VPDVVHTHYFLEGDNDYVDATYICNGKVGYKNINVGVIGLVGRVQFDHRTSKIPIYVTQHA
jgi:hypothetical protein